MIDKKKLQARARKQKQTDSLKAQGLVPVLCWVLPENKQAIREFEQTMRIKSWQSEETTAT